MKKIFESRLFLVIAGMLCGWLIATFVFPVGGLPEHETEAIMLGTIENQPPGVVTDPDVWQNAAEAEHAVPTEALHGGRPKDSSRNNMMLIPATDFTLPDIDGQLVSLSQFRGHPIILNFWATWCPPCVEEMPLFEMLYQELSDQELIIVAVNSDDSIESITRFVEEHGLSFEVLQDEQAGVVRDYGIFALPTTYFINDEGYIEAQYTGLLTEEMMYHYLSQLGMNAP